MQQIKDLQEAYLCLKEKQLLVSVFGKRKSYFKLSKEAISVSFSFTFLKNPKTLSSNFS